MNVVVCLLDRSAAWVGDGVAGTIWLVANAMVGVAAWWFARGRFFGDSLLELIGHCLVLNNAKMVCWSRCLWPHHHLGDTLNAGALTLMLTKRVVIPGLAVFLVSVGILGAVRILHGRQGASLLVVDEDALSLGAVWAAPEYQHKLTVRNRGSAPLTINRFVTSCGCAHVTPAEACLEAGQQKELDLKLNLYSAFNGKHSNAFSAPFQTTLTADLGNKAIPPLPWKVTGTVTRLLIFPQSPYVITDRLTTGTPLPTQELVVKLADNLKPEAVQVTCSPEMAVAKTTGSKHSDKNLNVRLTLNPNLKVGPFGFDVVFNVQSDHQSKPVRVLLPVQGEVLDSIQLQPSFITLGPTRLGHQVEAQLTAVCASGAQFLVSSIECTDPDLAVEKTGDPHVFRVRIVYAAERQQTRRIMLIVTTLPEQRVLKLPCVINYYGLGK